MRALVCGGDEAFEERVRLVRLAAELGMELAPDEEWMIGQFDDLHQPPVRRLPTEAKFRLQETLAIGIVDSYRCRWRSLTTNAP